VVVLTRDVDAEPTQGRSLPRLLRAVAAVAAVLLVGAVLRLAGDETTQPEVAATEASPPEPSSTVFGMPAGVAGRWTCPVGLPYAAYSGFRFFPPNHPGHPQPTIKPEACFATGPAARAAGYSEAIVVGSRTVEGVYLIPLPDQPRERCRPAADLLGFTVPCPTLLPNLTYGVIPSTCSGGGSDAPSDEVCVWYGSAFLYEEGAFDVPPEYHPPNARNVPHLFVAAWTDTSRRGVPLSLFRASLTCPGATRTASLDIALAGVPAMARADVLACGQGNNPAFDHILVRWRSGGVTYEVGVLGFTRTSLHLATAVIASLVFVEPSARSSPRAIP
jgi:hypothetical protein